jgi:DNA polymerase I-like protein with 3'-5' exonuclease and polymerase domains
VAGIRASQPDVIGLDLETEVLRAFRQPIPVAFNKDGKPAVRQPRDGAAGAALDPYRSKVRLVQAWAGGQQCFIFDMRTVGWGDIAPLFDLPLAIFNAVFEVKRLIHEAGIEPTGRIFDVMTAHWLTDGQRPSLADAVLLNYNILIPKGLGSSDWSADVLTPEQLEYAALDAVLCRLLWLTQQTELFDDIDKQCQEVADAAVPAIARMELNGMPIDTAAHQRQVAQWEADLITAQTALSAKSPLRDIQRPIELQLHLREVLNDDALAAWPRTSTGKLTTRRQQLQINADLPAINELLKVRALRKMFEAFGESLITAINPVTGRLHASFMIAGASTGRFSARGPNLQQMPKGRQKSFRKIFAAPTGQLVMALDYSQIELRAVAELISDWFGIDSVLRQHFASAWMRTLPRQCR